MIRHISRRCKVSLSPKQHMCLVRAFPSHLVGAGGGFSPDSALVGLGARAGFGVGGLGRGSFQELSTITNASPTLCSYPQLPLPREEGGTHYPV